MPARTLSSDASTLHSISQSISQSEHLDPEIRLQIQSNIHAIYEPSVASLYHITTSRGPDGTYIAFLSKQDNVAKALLNPSLLASEPRSSRNAAMLSLLEATEQRIHEMLVKSNPMRDNHGKKSSNTVSTPDTKVTRTPTSDEVSIDYGEKPKEKGFPWKKHIRVESAYARKVCN
ncbi:hypothetical protein EPUS_03504 [Endocarpon pusillum Z07020]|uniref:Uncharacterized protein n=1 Tax=Endocarpon pusillum (strain Z07020 / HMAS-L-300199) TaxID=1263415 RepID=U1HQI0_ENDPU|nr:uncharacterized protein EPUS_03504 [Endocarpon pusillum Z07020]ERF71349.1 hypothetical protein EPUS_03504 [Endocarpon pusillum Z07020]